MLDAMIALKVDEQALAGFPDTRGALIKRIADAAELEAIAEISRDIGRKTSSVYNVARKACSLRQNTRCRPLLARQ